MPREAYPMCVRHLKERKDVRLRHFFLCDRCCNEWTRTAFDGNKSLYTGEKVTGYCLLCNRRLNTIRLRTWFLCDICDRVARSIGRNHIAEQSIIDYWEEHVSPRFPTLKLIQNDKSVLQPHRPQVDESGVADIDFIVREKNTDLFTIENKTGRSSIREMSKFQLDISDCDCITHSMTTLGIPAYLIHAQVLETWEPPTMGFRPVGLWWTDVYKMAAHYASTHQRRDESRNAAFFNKKAFHEISTFADAIMGQQTYALVEQFQRERMPALYHS